MAIKLGNQRRGPGRLRTIKIKETDLPQILPVGTRCQILSITPDQLKHGDIVATHRGKFRRFWSWTGPGMWVTDRTGLQHQLVIPKDGLTHKVLVKPTLAQDLTWMLGAMVGWLRRQTTVKSP